MLCKLVVWNMNETIVLFILYKFAMDINLILLLHGFINKQILHSYKDYGIFVTMQNCLPPKNLLFERKGRI